MKRIIIISFLFLSFSLFAQKGEYQFEYRLRLPSTEAYQYMEYKTVETKDTGSSFQKYLDTVTYNPTIYVLDSELNPAIFFNVYLLDGDKNLLKTYKNDKFDNDSILINIDSQTTYIAFDINGETDTVLFYYHADQIPQRIFLIGSNFNGLTWPILRCKQKLNPLEMEGIYRSILMHKESDLLKCKTCLLSFEF